MNVQNRAERGGWGISRLAGSSANESWGYRPENQARQSRDGQALAQKGEKPPSLSNQKLTLARVAARARSDGTQSDDKAVAPEALRHQSSCMCARRPCDKVRGKSGAGQP